VLIGGRVKNCLRIIGVVIGAVFGLFACVAIIRLLSSGNVIEEAFLFPRVAAVSLLTGAIAGAIVGTRAARRLSAKPSSDTERVEQRRFILALALGIPSSRNGAGKSTLIRVLLGLARSDAGKSRGFAVLRWN
jgi:hypothetical protein